MTEFQTLWWMLQLQLPQKNEDQADLFFSPGPNNELIHECIKVITKQIRFQRNSSKWGLADLQHISDNLVTFKLTVRPPSTRIAEELEPGHLEKMENYRFFTHCVLLLYPQVIFVHRSSDVARYARSAKTFADIFSSLIKDAIDYKDLSAYYRVEVEPIAEVGSFVEWFNSIDELNKITIKYFGPNLPSGPGPLINSLKETAHKLQNSLHASDVDMVANKPKLDIEEVKELDSGVANRRIKMRARGTKSGVGISWSSETKPVPETAAMPFSPDQLDDNNVDVAYQIEDFYSTRVTRENIDGEK